MATKKQTKWHYVLVLTEEGPKFVTGIGEGKTAFWNKLEKPREFSDSWADDLAIGLCANGYMAYHVVMKFELDTHPYFYSKGHFEWKWDEKEETE